MRRSKAGSRPIRRIRSFCRGRSSDAERALHAVDLNDSAPTETALAANIAEYMLSTRSWEDTTPPLRMALPRVVLQLDNRIVMHATVALFRTAAEKGGAARAVALLDELNLQERLRPIYEALRIHASGNRDALNRLASELRDPVMQLLDSWQVHDGAPPSPQPQKKRKAVPRRKRTLLR